MSAKNNSEPTFGKCLHNFYGGESSLTAIAASVAMDNDMLDEMDPVAWNLWLGLAKAIEDDMMSSDEPRFTLYDYLDAAVNGPDNWEDLARQARANNNDLFWSRIVELAQKKRDTYESDNPEPGFESAASGYNTAVIMTDKNRIHPEIVLLSVPDDLIERDCAGLAVKRRLAEIVARNTGTPINDVTWRDVNRLSGTELADTGIFMETEPFMLVMSGIMDDCIAPMCSFKQDIRVTKNEADRVLQYIENIAQQPEGDAIQHTTVFPDGMEMTITCSAASACVPSSVHAALYAPDGTYLVSTIPYRKYVGPWTLEHNGHTYTAEICVTNH